MELEAGGCAAGWELWMYVGAPYMSSAAGVAAVASPAGGSELELLSVSAAEPPPPSPSALLPLRPRSEPLALGPGSAPLALGPRAAPLALGPKVAPDTDPLLRGEDRADTNVSADVSAELGALSRPGASAVPVVPPARPVPPAGPVPPSAPVLPATSLPPWLPVRGPRLNRPVAALDAWRRWAAPSARSPCCRLRLLPSLPPRPCGLETEIDIESCRLFDCCA